MQEIRHFSPMRNGKLGGPESFFHEAGGEVVPKRADFLLFTKKAGPDLSLCKDDTKL